MTITWLGATVAGALFGGLVAPALTTRGLLQLKRVGLRSKNLLLIGAIGGAAAGAATVLAALRLDIWALAPALLLWGAGLVAAACCDAVTQRVPTSLVRQAGVVTFVLLTSGLALYGDWRGLLVSMVAPVASGLTLLLCWRFAGAGFGDVRLAALGGLGLGHSTHRGLLLGLAAFILIVVAQAMVTVVRGGDRRTMIPYGPALAVGFLLAAAL
ncbi:leader peptidase (prepilin peptidase) / N-methyltransferase [Modestobacter sp. DSM 44400]|nr:leader peptidase (prepilin peptidase) / N-methyltransferase [Modestobacter sp. DSM 44400]